MAPSLDPFPDLCLIAIFMHLPLSDLLAVVGLVCVRWRFLLPTVLARRRSLKIVPPNVVPKLFESQSQFGSGLIYHVRRDDGSPWVMRPIADTRNVVTATARILTEPFTDGLMDSLLNITNLTVCGQNVPEYLLPELFTQIIRLLNHWQDSLVSLNLSFKYNFAYRLDENIEPIAMNLYESIDRLRSLRHLEIDSYFPWVNIHRFEPEFRIFAHLNTFTFRDFDIQDWIMRSMRLYVNPVVMTQIILSSSVDLRTLMEFTPQLASKFTFVDIFVYPIAEYNIGSLDMIKTFCSRFSSVQYLHIRLSADLLHTISPNLAQLQQLVHIRLHLLANYHYGPRELTPINSVRLLTIDMSKYNPSNSHQDFESCWLPQLFPNVQVLQMFHNSYVCQECGYEYQLNRFEDHPEIWPKVDECKRMARQALTRFPKLHTIKLEQYPGTSDGTLTDSDIFDSLEQL